MKISKRMSLKKGEDSISISGVYSDSHLLPALTVECFNEQSEVKSNLTIDIKSNPEVFDLFKKLTDFKYWDIVQFELDTLKLTDILSDIVRFQTEDKKIIPVDVIKITTMVNHKVRREFNFLNPFVNRGVNYKPKIK